MMKWKILMPDFSFNSCTKILFTTFLIRVIRVPKFVLSLVSNSCNSCIKFVLSL